MIDRVFDFFERPCDCSFPVADGSEMTVRILHISRRKAILATGYEMPLHAVIPVKLDFELGPDLELKARVEGAGENGLFLELLHPDQDSESQLQSLLIEYSTRERCEDEEQPDDWFGQDDEDEDETEDSPHQERTLRSNILSRTRTVRSRDLAASHQNVRVVNMSCITTLINESVQEAVESTGRILDEEERQRLLDEAKGTFQERLRDMQAERAGLIAKATRLEEQLSRARTLLAEERQREVSADQFTMSSAGMIEIEASLECLFQQVAAEVEAPETVREQMRGVIATLLDEERERLREREEQAHNEKIRLLEHKVGRLAQALQETGRERDEERHRANALEAMSSGVAGIKVKSQLGEDPAKVRKMALLKELIDDNRDVRNHMSIDKPAGGERPDLNTALAKGDTVTSGGLKRIEAKRGTPPPLELSP